MLRLGLGSVGPDVLMGLYACFKLFGVHALAAGMLFLYPKVLSQARCFCIQLKVLSKHMLLFYLECLEPYALRGH